jgi:hypothetical protein
MIQIKQIGDRDQILGAIQDRDIWEALIGSIANMTENELTAWFNNHFSGLSANIRTGLETIVKALWANAKVTKRLGNKINI